MGKSSTGPGRPRDDELDEKIFNAALKLIDEDRSITVNAIVAESGVSRAAIYRRWPSLTDLTAAALDKGREVVKIDTSGPIRDALKRTFFGHPETLRGGEGYTHSRFRKRIELVMGNQDLHKAYWNSHVRRRRVEVENALALAKERGEIRADVDIDSAIDAINGVFYYQLIARGVTMSDQGVLERCEKALDIIWRGLE